jgi:hypothetical protein
MEAAGKSIYSVRRIGGFMVKAKDFWNVLCNDLDYRFFAGVACPGLLSLYKTMSPEMMHYIPAANERIALGLVSGVYISGFKGALLMDMRFESDIIRLLNFNIEYKIPFLIIGYGSSGLSLPKVELKSLKDLNTIDKKSVAKLLPGIITIEEGTLI